jgi:hypothetical protein
VRRSTPLLGVFAACLAIAACGGGSADTAPTEPSVASTTTVAETVAASESVMVGTTPATTSAVGTSAPLTAPPATPANQATASTAAPAPPVSADEVAELEQALDEIDQILIDLEADLAADESAGG